MSIELAANADYWGGAPSIASVTYEFVAEGGTRLAGLKSGKYDLITNLPPQDVDAGAAVGPTSGPGAPDPDPRRRRGHHRRPQRAHGAQPGGRQAGDRRQRSSAASPVIDDGQLLSAVDPRLQRHARGLCLRPRRGQAPDRGGRRRRRDDHARRRVVGPLAERPRPARGRRRLLDARPVSRSTSRRREFGAYLDVLFDRENRADAIFVSSSNDILDPDRQLTTYYQAGGIGSSNTDEELSALIDEGRSELDPDARAAIYQEAVKIAYDEALLRLARQQPGPLRAVRAAAAGRRGSTPSCSSRT